MRTKSLVKKTVTYGLVGTMLFSSAMVVPTGMYLQKNGECGITYSIHSKESGILTTSAKSKKFIYSGGKVKDFKKQTTFVITKSLSSKDIKQIQNAYFADEFVFETVKTLEFSDSVTKVSSRVLGCFPNVKTIKLGKKVSSFPGATNLVNYDGSHAMPKLASIQVSKKNKKYSAKDGVLYNNKKTSVVLLPCAWAKDTYEMPDTLLSLNDSYAIYDSKNISSIVVSSAFEGSLPLLYTLSNLKEITVKDGNTEYACKDGVLYNKAFTQVVCYPANTGRKEIVVEDTVRALNTTALPKDITSLVLPRDLENLFCDDSVKGDDVDKKYPLNSFKELEKVTVAKDCKAFVVYGCGLYSADYTVAYGIPYKAVDKEIAFPEGLKKVSTTLLKDHTTIEKITIPASLVDVGLGIEGGYISDDDAEVNDCTLTGWGTLSSLKEYVVAEENTALEAIDGVLYTKGATHLVGYPCKKDAKTFTLPDATKTIYKYTIDANCDNIETLVIGKSLTSIPYSGLDLVNLVEYKVSDANAYFCERDGVLYNKKQTAVMGYPQKKTNKSFTCGRTVRDINGGSGHNIPFNNEYLKELIFEYDGSDFYISNTLNMTVPNLERISVNKYMELAVKDGVVYSKDMKKLVLYPAHKTDSSFTIPNSVESIGNFAFSNNPYLKKLKLGKNVKRLCVGSWGSELDAITLGLKCPKLSEITVHKDNKNFASKKGVLYSKNMKTLWVYPEGKKDKTYTIPNTVTGIKMLNYNFGMNKNLKKIKVQKGNKKYYAEGKTVRHLSTRSVFIELTKEAAKNSWNAEFNWDFHLFD